MTDNKSGIPIRYDENTQQWFASHINAQTTVIKCDVCGFFYKPSLGHKCFAKYRRFNGNSTIMVRA